MKDKKFGDYGGKVVNPGWNNPKLNAVGLRWVAALADYNFTIKYKAGKENVDADALSRNPMDIAELKGQCTETFDSWGVGAVLAGVDMVSVHPSISCSNVSVCELKAEGAESVIISKEELVEAQKSDAVISPVLDCIESGIRPKRSVWDKLSKDSKLLMRNFSKLKVTEEGVLVRKTAQRQQVVLPQKFRQLVYTELHEKMAHIGAEKVIDLAQQRFFWPHMGRDIETYIRKKCRCVVTKKPNIPERAPLVPITATHPFEMISIDFLHLDRCKGGFEYGLVVIDHFTRFCQIYATRKKSSKAAAAKLFGEFILQFGFPKQIHHDLGGEFNSQLFKELHRLTKIQSSNTTPYHPMGDGQVERCNRTIINMLKALPEREKKNWKYHLPKLSFAYNSTVNKTTGFSPFYLMFGRESKLPIDSMFAEDVWSGRNKSHSEFVEEWQKSMKEAYELANKRIEKAAGYNKQYYDKKVHEVEVGVGDQVLVRNMREKGGTGKLRSHWERSLFTVEEKKNNLPVYKVKNVNNSKDVRVLHRNMLMKAEELPRELFESEVKNSKMTPRKKETIKKSSQQEESEAEKEREDDVEGIEVRVYQERTPVSLEDEGEGTEVPEALESTLEESVENLEAVMDVVEEVEVLHEEETLGEEDNEEQTEENAEVEEAVEVEETENGEDSEDSDDEGMRELQQNLRRSTRVSKKKAILTYDELGGEPKLR